jgi:hypothetical protein
MISYKVGKPFPHPEQQAPGYDMPRAMVNSSFFDVLFYAADPVADAPVFTKKSLRYGVFQRDDIPFFIIDFPGEFNFEVSININHVDNDHVEAWLNSTGNLVTLFLIDARTNIVYGIRAVSLKPVVAEEIRDICERQDARYPGPGNVYTAMRAITNSLTTEQMMAKTTMYSL